MIRRFEQVMQTLQMIAAIFTAFFLAMLGYAWWDRRTIVRKEALSQSAPLPATS
ncbi:MAG: hypothetical protein VX610_04985 [SAR324 cluster bacterium]|nr:hypothetical protein [SAR324 cluster bacterium]